MSMEQYLYFLSVGIMSVSCIREFGAGFTVKVFMVRDKIPQIILRTDFPCKIKHRLCYLLTTAICCIEISQQFILK